MWRDAEVASQNLSTASSQQHREPLELVKLAAQTRVSALKEFRAAVAREFAFLVTDFGFAEERVRRPANEFSVWFVNAPGWLVVHS